MTGLHSMEPAGAAFAGRVPTMRFVAALCLSALGCTSLVFFTRSVALLIFCSWGAGSLVGDPWNDGGKTTLRGWLVCGTCLVLLFYFMWSLSESQMKQLADALHHPLTALVLWSIRAVQLTRCWVDGHPCHATPGT